MGTREELRRFDRKIEREIDEYRELKREYLRLKRYDDLYSVKVRPGLEEELEEKENEIMRLKKNRERVFRRFIREVD